MKKSLKQPAPSVRSASLKAPGGNAAKPAARKTGAKANPKTNPKANRKAGAGGIKRVAGIKRAAVIGLGYVGLPLAVEMAKAGIEAIGVDVDKRKVDSIMAGKSYITDIDDAEISRWVKKGLLRATTDFDALKDVQAISICVPTPLRKTKDPDVSFIAASVEQIVPRLQPGQLIILESTSYPGTTDEMVLTALSTGGRQAGRDFFLAFSPERVDPANPTWKTRNTPKVIGGVTPECTRRASKFYGLFFDRIVPVSSTRSAEMVKLLENTFRAVNIGLVNEVALMCNKLGLDVWEVIEAAATKPFGFMPFFPGPGLGGHCIPIDPLYLSWKLKALNYTARFIELASEINTAMPQYVVTRIAEALNQQAKPIKGTRILILGAAYKKNVSDVRESPALDILQLLHQRGAKVEYHDPHVPSLREGDLTLKSVPLTPKKLKEYDMVVLVTNHDAFDIKSVVRNARLLFDTRNAARGLGNPPNVIRL